MANTSGPQSSIGNGQTMNSDAAAYFNSLIAEIKSATGYTIIPTEGTRTYARQKELYDGYRLGRIDPATGKKYNPAWPPDSPYAYHLSGRAVDVGSSVGYVSSPQAQAWRSRMIPYGFRETVSGEPWHFEWRKEWSSISISPAGSGATPIDEDDMSEAQYKDLKASIDFLGDRVGKLQASIDIVGDQNRGTQIGLNAVGDTTRETLAGVNIIGDLVRGVQKSVDIVGAQNRDILSKVEPLAPAIADAKQSSTDGLNNLGKILVKVWTITNNIASKVGSKRED